MDSVKEIEEYIDIDYVDNLLQRILKRYKNNIKKELFEIKEIWYELYKFIYSENQWRNIELTKFEFKNKKTLQIQKEGFKKLSELIHKDKNNILLLIDEQFERVKEKYLKLGELGKLADEVFEVYKLKGKMYDLSLFNPDIERYLDAGIRKIRNDIILDFKELTEFNLTSKLSSTEVSSILQSRIKSTLNNSLHSIKCTKDEKETYNRYYAYMNRKFEFLATLRYIDKRNNLVKIRNKVFNNLIYEKNNYTNLLMLISTGFEFYKSNNSLELTLINIMYQLSNNDKDLTKQICTSTYETNSLIDKRTYIKYKINLI